MRKFYINKYGNLNFNRIPVSTLPFSKFQKLAISRDFDKIRSTIETSTEISHISWCNELLSNFKTIYHVTDEDGSVIILSDVLKQKEAELYNNFTL